MDLPKFHILFHKKRAQRRTFLEGLWLYRFLCLHCRCFQLLISYRKCARYCFVGAHEYASHVNSIHCFAFQVTLSLRSLCTLIQLQKFDLSRELISCTHLYLCMIIQSILTNNKTPLTIQLVGYFLLGMMVRKYGHAQVSIYLLQKISYRKWIKIQVE